MTVSYTARVKGTYGIFPRGYRWINLAWETIAVAVVVIVGITAGFPSSGIVTVLVVGVVSAIYMFYFFSHITPRAFAADSEGIRLGITPTRSRLHRGRYVVITWDQIAQITVAATSAGSTADVVLTPSARVLQAKALPAPVEFALKVTPPFGYLVRPAMLKPLANPPRYHVPLYRVTTADLVSALRSFAPASVSIDEVASSYSSR
jgi:hypothetical protein